MLSIGIRLSIDDFALAFKRLGTFSLSLWINALSSWSWWLVIGEYWMWCFESQILFRCRPVPLSVGFTAQYILKPALGVLVARAFGMPQMFYAGFVLMSCVAGAQLSSYASFLSKGDVALSILLTSSSTIASVLVTPVLTGLLIGSVVPVDAIAMSKSILQVWISSRNLHLNHIQRILIVFQQTNCRLFYFVIFHFQVVLAPVTLGLVLNTYAKPIVSLIQPVMPFVAMICTSLCIGSPLAINQSQILSSEGLRLIGPVLTFHAVAFTLGYWISKIPILRYSPFRSHSLVNWEQVLLFLACFWISLPTLGV